MRPARIFRTDLPTERSNEGGDKTCVVVVVQKPEKDKSHPAGVAGLLERAKAKQVPTASQDWVKHCLLEQKVLELSRFPAVVSERVSTVCSVTVRRRVTVAWGAGRFRKVRDRLHITHWK